MDVNGVTVDDSNELLISMDPHTMVLFITVKHPLEVKGHTAKLDVLAFEKAAVAIMSKRIEVMEKMQLAAAKSAMKPI